MTQPASESPDEGLVRTSSAEIRRRQQASVGSSDEWADSVEPETDDQFDELDERERGDEQQPPPEPQAEPAENAGSVEPGYQTIDEVARRHADDAIDAGRPKGRKKRKKKSTRRGQTYPAAHVPDTPPEPVQVKTAADPTPYEGDPLRDPGVVAVGPIEPAEGEQFPDMSGGDARHPANLSDICRLYRLGRADGDCHLRVERKAPKTYQGTNTEGYLGKIRRPIDEAEFRDMAGGGVYELVVWGPNPRGHTDPYTGQVEVKPLTKPITIKMPGAPYFVDFDEDDEPRRRDMPAAGWDPMERRGRVVPMTTGEASIQKEALSVIRDTIKDAKEENRQLKEETRASSTRSNVDTGVIDFLKSSSKEGLDAVREAVAAQTSYLQQQLDQERARSEKLEAKIAERDAERGAAPEREYSGLAQIIGALNPSRDQSGDIQRVYDQHVRELERASAQHERAIEALRSSYDDRLRGKDEEIRRLQDHYDKREKDLRDEFERRERQLRDEVARRETDLKERYEQQLTRQREDHARELESRDRQEGLVRETHKVSWETRIASAEERARLAQEEADRAREEAAKKADLPTMIEEYSQMASALGFKKAEDDAPKDWKERLAQSVGSAVENLPTLLERASDTLRTRDQVIQSQTEAMRTAAAMRQQAAPVRPAARPSRTIRGAGGSPVNVPRPAGWATEDAVAVSRHPPTDAEMRPEQRPPPTEDEARRAAAEREHQAVHGSHVQESAPAPAAASPQPASPAVASKAPKASPQMIEQLRKNFETAFQQGAEPEQIATDLHQAWGSEMLRTVLASLSVEELVEALGADPKAATSPLLTRDGTTWFRAVWAHGERLVAQQV